MNVEYKEIVLSLNSQESWSIAWALSEYLKKHGKCQHTVDHGIENFSRNNKDIIFAFKCLGVQNGLFESTMREIEEYVDSKKAKDEQ